MKKDDLEFIYREILQMIQNLCYINFHSLHEFVVENDELSSEYRLSGHYGFGFKIIYQNKCFYFTQYSEDETDESNKWIKEHNEHLKQLCTEN